MLVGEFVPFRTHSFWFYLGTLSTHPCRSAFAKLADLSPRGPASRFIVTTLSQ